MFIVFQAEKKILCIALLLRYVFMDLRRLLHFSDTAQFSYIKEGCKGVYITHTYFHDYFRLQLCFAYKGLLQNYVWLHYSYKDGVTGETKTATSRYSINFNRDSDTEYVLSLRKHAHAIYRKKSVPKIENYIRKFLIFFLFLLKT